MSGQSRTSFGWAVLFPEGKEWGCPGVPLLGTINGTRQLSMNDFVAWWRSGAHDGWSVSAVWRQAYRRGWRLARVSITPALGYDK